MYKYTILMSIHRYITIFDISIQPKCVLIQYHCLMYHDMAIYQYIVASLPPSMTSIAEYKFRLDFGAVEF